MQQRQRLSSIGKKERFFTASEVAEFEYCPLVWWYQQYEPMAQADTEELFARLVELEHENGSEAPALPEYQMIEQLLVRKGAFDEGRELHFEHAQEVKEVEEERITPSRTTGNTRLIAIVALVLFIVAVLFIGVALLLR